MLHDAASYAGLKRYHQHLFAAANVKQNTYAREITYFWFYMSRLTGAGVKRKTG